VASITFSNEGVRLVNLGASAGEEALPTSVFISRSMFVLYNIYPSEGDQDVQIIVNFSTLMEFLERALADLTQEDLGHPLHIVLDNWLYIRYEYHAYPLSPLSPLSFFHPTITPPPITHFLCLFFLFFFSFSPFVTYYLVYNNLRQYVTWIRLCPLQYPKKRLFLKGHERRERKERERGRGGGGGGVS
jgi:hypothetical protein